MPETEVMGIDIGPFTRGSAAIQASAAAALFE